jgi:hypothetical protein
VTPAPHDPSRRRGLRAVALVSAAALSCATVRVPASGIPPSVTVRGDVADPQVELWIESGEHVSPQEAAKAAADARAALEQALASRNLGAGEQLLVVRAQGVSRTRSHRTDQKAAVAGIVVGAVAVIAIVVVVLVASQGKGGGGGGGKAPVGHPAPVPGARPAPPPGTVTVRPAPPPAPPPVAAVPRPAGGPGPSPVAIGVGVDVQVAVPAPPEGPPPAAVWGESVVTAPPPPRARPEAAVTEVVLPAPPPLEIGRRGFFDDDLTRLELTLVDRATGAPLWVKTVEKDVDPRDAKAVRALLDAALDAPGGWEPAPAAPAR